ncbi:MAG: polyprenol phosphomannose-dependent alpha 1,6 mannosyltransferase MptB [Ferrimicrobium sp.]
MKGPEELRTSARLRRSVRRLQAVGRSSLWNVDPLVVGTTGSLAILFGSLQANSPFTSKVPGSWFIGVSSTPTQGNSLVELGANSLVYLGLLLLGMAWVRVVYGIRVGEGFARPWLTFAMWVIPLMIAGPLFSRDVYSYAAQGQMVTQGLNPYHGGPASLGTSPFMPTADPLWGRAKAPYGPLFLMLDGALVQLSGHSPMISVLLLRLVALASVIGIGIFIRKIARLTSVNEDLAFALSAANPLLLYTFASAGHNDALMTVFMVAGIYFFLKDQRFVGIVLVALGAAVKVPAIVALGFLGFQWSRSERGMDRLRGLVIAVMIVVAIFVVLGELSHLGLGWIAALQTPGSVLSFEDPLIVVGYGIGWVIHLTGLPIGPYLVISAIRVLSDVLILIVGTIAILGSKRSNMIRLTGAVLLITVALGPVIWPWYLAWGIVLLGLGGGDLTIDFLVVLTLAALPIDLLGLPSAFAWVGYVGLGWVVYKRREHLVRDVHETFDQFRVVVHEVVPKSLYGMVPRVLRIPIHE